MEKVWTVYIGGMDAKDQTFLEFLHSYVGTMAKKACGLVLSNERKSIKMDIKDTDGEDEWIESLR